MASVSTFIVMVVSVMTLNMMIKIALVVFISGFNRAEARTVDNRINNHADKRPAGTARRNFAIGLISIAFTTQFNQPLLPRYGKSGRPTLELNSIVTVKDITSTASSVEGMTAGECS